MSSIVTNVAALNAQRNLGVTGMKMGKVFEKLSSGYRINRAADDAAGLGISEKMRAQIRGNAQAIRNAQDGISMIQTAEGAMDEVHSILQRIRELGVQAANDTYDVAARDSIGTEINQLRMEIDRIANGTQFNGQQLLTGNLSSTPASVTGGTIVVGTATAQSTVGGNATNLQVGKALVGTNSFAGTVTGISLDANAQALLGPETFNIATPGGGSGTVTLTGATSGVVLTGTAVNVLGAQSTVFSGTVNGNTVNVTLNYNVAVIGTVNVGNAAAGLVSGGNLVLQNDAAAQATVQSVVASTTTVGGTYTLSAVNGNPTQLSVSDGVNPAFLVTAPALTAGQNTLTLGGTGITLTLSASGPVSAAAVVHDLTTAPNNTIIVTGAAGGAVLQVGANVSSYDEMNISFNDVRASQASGLNLVNQTVTTAQATALAANVNVDFSTYTTANGIVGSNDRAQALVYVVDQAIQTLNTRRATLGAAQNRLEHTVNSLGVAVENLTASESRIRDADVASLSSQLVSSQILQQAGTAVLAQANQASQSVLTLLK